MTYNYTISGLDYVYLKNGYTNHETDYGPGVSIEDADELDESIALYIITDLSRLAGQDVRFIRSMLDYSQAKLANALGVTRLTVIRWENKPHALIPGAADRFLRVLADKELFEGTHTDLIVSLSSDISGKRTSDLYMFYLPEEQEEDGWSFKEAA